MLKVGLTGGIASGKTHVLRRFVAAGFRTIDLDAVSREVMARGGTAYHDVVSAFGPGILAEDGAIDRRALGRIAFADRSARRRLESIVHPRIREVEAAALAAGADVPVVVVDAALLLETGSHLRFDRMVVAYCEPQEQLCRLMARDGISEAAARARIDAQMPGEEKRGFGHHVIDTTDSVADTDARADAVAAALRGEAARPPGAGAVRPESAVAMMERGPHWGPRGLNPWGLVEEIGSAGTLDLARAALQLRPPHDGPWYLAPETAPPGQRPESLAVPVALWSAGRRPGDEAYAVSAASALARLTHRDAAEVSGAVVAALAAGHALSGDGAPLLRGRLARWIAAASAWTGSAPPAPVVDTVLAAAAHPADRDAAAQAAQIAGGLPGLARALAGGELPPLAPERLRAVERVLAGARAV